MADNKINGPRVQPQNLPPKPTTGKAGAPTLNASQAAANSSAALSQLERATTEMASAAASLSGGTTANVLGGAAMAKTSSALAAGDIPQTGFSLESFNISAPDATSLREAFSSLPKPNAKDRQALNTEMANVYGKLSEKFGEQVANKLKTIIQSAEDIAAKLADDPQAREALKECIRLGKDLNVAEGGPNLQALSSISAHMTGAAVEDLTTRLNGAGGKAFGEIGDIIGKSGAFKNVDLSNMPIEDAIQMMFMLISEDARKDTKELLIDMDAIRKQKSALREATTLTKEQNALARQEARKYYDDLVEHLSPEEKATFPDFNKWLGTQQMQSAVIETNPETGTAEMKSPAKFLPPEAPPAAGSGGTLATETTVATSPTVATTSPPVTSAAPTSPPVTSSSSATFVTTPAATVSIFPGLLTSGVTIMTNMATMVTNYTLTAMTQTVNPHVLENVLAGQNIFYQIENPDDPVINPGDDNLLANFGIGDAMVIDTGPSGGINTGIGAGIGETLIGGGNFQNNINNQFQMGNFVGNQEAGGEAQRLESGATPTEIIGGKVSSFETADVDLGKLQDAKDSLSEQSEEQQLKMQMHMDRMTKADSARSNAMKKFSEIASQIIGNWK
jgi:hypothetical protein